MDGNPDLAGLDVEKPAGFDDLQALVEHGGRIDGDAATHVPGGVLEGLLGRDGCELIERELAERAARGGEPDGLDFVVGAGAQALVDGVVLAVNGQDRDAEAAGSGGEDFAGGDHALLVGEADGLSGEDSGVGGFETGDADDRGDDEVDVWQCGAGDGAFGPVRDVNA